jgi:DNA-binding PucR family transcriptional regulator
MGSVYLGSDNRPFFESDLHLANHFFDYFQKAFLKYLHTAGVEESTKNAVMLQKLLDHSPVSIDAYDPFNLQPDECWVCFALKEKPHKKGLPKDYMSATLNTVMSKSVYVTIYHDEIVGLLRVHRDRGSTGQNTTMASFCELLERMDYIGGLSHEFTDVQQFDNYFLQASYAAERGAQKNEGAGGPVFFFDNYLLQYMLHICAEKLPVEALCSRGLQTLIDHDKRKNREYVKTLDTYLKNEMSLAKTAKALFVQRSSLFKRLEKIRRLIGDDLNDTNVRLYYRISFRLLENSFTA